MEKGLENLQIYQISMEIGEKIWKLVEGWNDFQKRTIGNQIIRSTDSIAANISEGFGRYHYKDKIRFLHFSRGSLFETKTWFEKANNRNLIENETYNEIINMLNTLGIKINNYINSLSRNLVNEDEFEYGN